MSAHDIYRQIATEQGQEFQDYVIDLFWDRLGIPLCLYTSRKRQLKTGEGRSGVEVKRDMRFRETGNLFIEYEEKATERSGPFAKSGICRRDNSWLYVIGDIGLVFLFSKKLLLQLKDSNIYVCKQSHTQTSCGFLLPLDDADKHSIITLRD